MVNKENGKTAAKVVRCYTTIVMEKQIESGQIRTFVTTNLGYATEMKFWRDNPLIYTGDRSTFTGFMVISDEEGNYLDSYGYENGIQKRIFIRKYSKEDPELQKESAFRGFQLFNNVSIRTKGGGGYVECSKCGGLILSGKCAVCNDPWEFDDTYLTFCATCFQRPENCTCCIYCMKKQENCTCGYGPPINCSTCGYEASLCICSNPFGCPICGNPFCNGGCSNGGGDEGGDPPPPPIEYVTVTISAGSGGSVLPDGTSQYVKGIQLYITATPYLGYMFTSWSGDANSTVQELNPTLNSNKSFYASFASVPNTTDGDLNSAFMSALNALSGSLQTQILKLFQNGKFTTSTYPSGMFHMGFDPNDNSAIFLYNPSILSSGKMNGMTLACLHELWHLDRSLNGGSNDHEAMVADSTYQSWIESLFSGFPSDMLALLKYSGATDTAAYDGLTQIQKDDFDAFILNNGFYK